MLSESRGISLRLAPTSNGVGVRVVIRSVELNYDLVKTRLLESRSKSGTNKQITKCGNVNFDWFILPLLLPTLTIWFSLDHKQNVGDGVGSGIKRNGMILLTPGFRHAYGSAYNSDLWFSLGHKLSYNSSNDSDSVASENQPLEIMQSKQC